MPVSPTGPFAGDALQLAHLELEPLVAEQRERDPLPEKGRRKIELRDIAQDALTQLHLRQVGHIPPVRDFGITAAVDIFEQEMGKPPFRQRTEIPDIRDVHACLQRLMRNSTLRTNPRAA